MSIKVLLVEDEDLLTQMYSRKFKADGYECHIAENGEKGVKIANEIKPDIILLDIMMPVKNGIEALKELKESQTTKDIPVIMLTNMSDEQYVEEAINLGAISYLVKSELRPADVVKKVKEILQAQGKKNLTTD